MAIISSKHIVRVVALVVATVVSLPAWPPTRMSCSDWEQAHAAALRIFGAGAFVIQSTIPLSREGKDTTFMPAAQRQLFDSINVLVCLDGDSILGYAAFDNVRGKDQFIMYLVAVDAELFVKDIEILAYRESYGGEVRYKSWQRQFIGKKPGDELRPGREIRNITGATISARSVTLGVQRVLTTLQHMKGYLAGMKGATR